MKVKALQKVPVLLDGEVVHIEPGEEYEVSEEVGAALLRGGDAEAVPEATQKKNAGRAPLNKDAGPAPEDK